MRHVLYMIRRILLVFCLAVVTSSCGNGDNESNGNDSSEPERPLTIAVITHGAGDTFWSVVKKGVEQAGKDMRVTVTYRESANDPQRQAQLIEEAVTEKVQGIATSVPNPDALRNALNRASDAGIPIITLNSGELYFATLGAITHLGQDEVVAGEAAGMRLAADGAKRLACIIHEQDNVGLQHRCEGATKGFSGQVVTVQVTGVDDILTTRAEIQGALQSDSAIDAVLTLNPDIAVAAHDAIKAVGSAATLATFDLSIPVLDAIKNGDIAFAVDQQQYLQGYLPVVFLTLYNTNKNTVGGGLPVLTGPGFVTKDNADTVEKLTQEGTR